MTDQELIEFYQAKIGGEYPPSPFQAKIYQWVENGRGDEIVNAVAGSGKTFTLINAAKLLRGQAIFIAFSKKIQETLQTKLQRTSMATRTVHSIGYGIVANYLSKLSIPVRLKSPDDKKYRKLAFNWCSQNQVLDAATKELMEDDIFPDWSASLFDLVHYCRATLTDPLRPDGSVNPRILSTASKYGVETYGYTELLAQGVASVIRDGAMLAKTSGEIDFTDMIYLPYYWRLDAPKYQWVFVDECQDLSACQLDLVLKTRGAGGRMLFVGDPFQAIFGFAGADCDSFWNIKAAIKANGLPLSVNYRCPATHIKAVKDRGTVPHIEARPNAVQGIIRDIQDDKLISEVREGDMIICRMTAPLISTAIDLIANRIPARVFGRDIGRELGSLAEKVCKKATFEDFIEAVNAYYEKEFKRLSKKEGNENKIQSLADKCECLRVIYTSSKVETLNELIDEIHDLFSDERASVTLCTVHRAKGLENPRIFIIAPERLPLKFKGQQDWQYQQELNLEYVAMTRAQEELVYVRTSVQAPTGALVAMENKELVDNLLASLGLTTTEIGSIDLSKPSDDYLRPKGPFIADDGFEGDTEPDPDSD